MATNADTYVKQGTPNQNQGAETSMRLQDSGNNRALLSFSTAAVIAATQNRTVVSAYIDLTIVDNGNNWGQTGRAVNFHKITVPWTELGSTWNCAIDANPSNSSPDCSATTEWNMSGPGARPWEPVASASTIITSNQLGRVRVDVTADVQGFIAGSIANNGWIIKKESEGAAGRVEFGARESASGAPRLVLMLAPVAAENVCGVALNFDNAQLPPDWNLAIIRGGPGLINNRLEGREVDGGGEVGRLYAAGTNASEMTITYRGNLDQSYHGMWDGIYLPMLDGTTWILNSSTQGYGGGVNPPNRLVASHFNGIFSGFGAFPGSPGAGGNLFDDWVIPEQGVYRYEIRLVSDSIRWTLRRDADNSLIIIHERALPGFNPAGVRGFSIFAYTTSLSPVPYSAHWVDDVAIACSN